MYSLAYLDRHDSAAAVELKAQKHSWIFLNFPGFSWIFPGFLGFSWIFHFFDFSIILNFTRAAL
jgi:hypothetical protein